MDTDFLKAPPRKVGDDMCKVLRRIVYLRQRFGPSGRIVLGKADVKEAFHQVLIDPARAASFGYVFHDLAVVDLLLEFQGNIPTTIRHFRGAVVSDIRRTAAEVIKMAPPRGGKCIELPTDCNTIRGEGGGTGNSFFMCVYVDDIILVEVQWFTDGRRCLHASQS